MEGGVWKEGGGGCKGGRPIYRETTPHVIGQKKRSIRSRDWSEEKAINSPNWSEEKSLPTLYPSCVTAVQPGIYNYKPFWRKLDVTFVSKRIFFVRKCSVR